MAFIMGDPEEIKRQQEEAIDGMRMAREVAANEMTDLLKTASREHLTVIKRLLHQIGHEDESPCAAYYEGLIMASLLNRFEVCLGCGEIHAPDELLTVDDEPEEL